MKIINYCLKVRDKYSNFYCTNIIHIFLSNNNKSGLGKRRTRFARNIHEWVREFSFVEKENLNYFAMPSRVHLGALHTCLLLFYCLLSWLESRLFFFITFYDSWLVLVSFFFLNFSFVADNYMIVPLSVNLEYLVCTVCRSHCEIKVYPCMKFQITSLLLSKKSRWSLLCHVQKRIEAIRVSKRVTLEFKESTFVEPWGTFFLLPVKEWNKFDLWLMNYDCIGRNLYSWRIFLKVNCKN